MLDLGLEKIFCIYLTSRFWEFSKDNEFTSIQRGNLLDVDNLRISRN